MSEHIITHLGKTVTTKHYKELTPEFCDWVRANFYKTSTEFEINDEFQNLAAGGTTISKIYHQYFYKLAAQCKLRGAKWSIAEVIQSDDIIKMSAAKFDAAPDVFTEDFCTNLRTIFRIGGSGVARQLSNYPFKECKELIRKYNTNNVYYDYSCGWGVRMLSALTLDINYIGTDPNLKLCDKLEEVSERYQEVNPSLWEQSTVEIKRHGSEILIPELIGKVGLSFSSPPYFDLEEYSDDPGQSLKITNSYDDWLLNYWTPTVRNIHHYLTGKGHFILNMKNLKKYACADDMNKIISENGFTYLESVELKNIERPSLKDTEHTTNELCYVYRKTK